MSYWLDVKAGRGQRQGGPVKDAVVVQVGCGGTGSFLAEAVCRLLIGRDADLVLVDLDRVETHNVGRQAFDPDEVGQFKAQVLAQRLAKRFGRTIGYAVRPYDAGLHSRIFRAQPSRLNLLIGAVDNAEARRALAATLDNRLDVLWLDCGNGRNSGQVLLGNATRAEDLRGAFPLSRASARRSPPPACSGLTSSRRHPPPCGVSTAPRPLRRSSKGRPSIRSWQRWRPAPSRGCSTERAGRWVATSTWTQGCCGHFRLNRRLSPLPRAFTGSRCPSPVLSRHQESVAISRRGETESLSSFDVEPRRN